MKLVCTQLLALFALISPILSSPIIICNSNELYGVAKAISSGDSILIKAGEYQLNSTLIWRNSGKKDCRIIILGEGIGKTIIRAPMGETGLNILGSHIFLGNMTLMGGKASLAISGNEVKVDWVEIAEGDKGIILAGDTCKLSRVWVHDCPTTGIEINGGYKYLPEASPSPIRVRTAVENDTYPQYTSYLSGLMTARNMCDTIEYSFIKNCGFKGMAINGGGIKAIPFVSGIYIYRTVAVDIGFSAFWIDAPSKGKNEIIECYAKRAKHGVHIELADSGEVNIVKNCIFKKVNIGIFNSSSRGSIFEQNSIYATKYGLVNHGIKGNRLGRTLQGNFRNNSVFLGDEGRAHVIWYTGTENHKSTRDSNSYLIFPGNEVLIGHTKVSGYGGIKNAEESDRLAHNEKVTIIHSTPKYPMPQWDIPGLK